MLFSEPIAARDAPLLLREAAKAIVAAENRRKLREWLSAQCNSSATDSVLLLGWLECQCKAMCIVQQLGGGAAELTLLVVAADARRRGYGAMMVRCAAHVCAKAAGCKILYANASTQLGFLGSCGMHAAESGAPSQSAGPWSGPALMYCMSLGSTQKQPSYILGLSVATATNMQRDVPHAGQLIGLWYPRDKAYMLARCETVMHLLEGESFVGVFYPNDEAHGKGQATRENEINSKTAGLRLLTTADARACEVKGGMQSKRTWFKVAEVPSQGWSDQIVLTAPQELRADASAYTAQSSTYRLDVLELFAGSAIISKVAKDSFGASTMAVDINGGGGSVAEGGMNCYTACDLSKADSIRILNLGVYDVIWAGPVCTTFSKLAYHKHGRTHARPEGTTPQALKANTMIDVLVAELLRLRKLNSNAIIFIEQPGLSFMQHLPIIRDVVEKSVDEGGLGLHRVRVTQCAFGGAFKKPHLIWCNCKEALHATQAGQYGCSPITCMSYGRHVRAQGQHAANSASYPERMAWQFLKWAQIDRMRQQPVAASGAEDDEDNEMEEPWVATSPSLRSSSTTPVEEERPSSSSDVSSEIPPRSNGKAKAKAGSSRTLRARKAGTSDDHELTELSAEAWEQTLVLQKKKPRRELHQDDEPTAHKTNGCDVEQAAPAPSPVVPEAQGWQLHLSDKSVTGYKCVSMSHSKFHAKTNKGNIGIFDTAVEAAVAYAKAVAKKGAAPPVEAVQELQGAPSADVPMPDAALDPAPMAIDQQHLADSSTSGPSSPIGAPGGGGGGELAVLFGTALTASQSHVVAPPGLQWINVIVPAAVDAGTLVTVVAPDGAKCKMTVPAWAAPGGRIRVKLPVAAARPSGSPPQPSLGLLLYGAPRSRGTPHDYEYELGVVMAARHKDEMRTLWWAEDEDRAIREPTGRWCDYLRKAQVIGSINLADGEVTLTARLNERPWSVRGDKWLDVKEKEEAIKSLAAAATRIHRAEREQSERQSRERAPSRKCVEGIAQAQ